LARRKKPPSKILYQAVLSLKNHREIKTLPDNQKLREFTTTRPLLLVLLKGVLQIDRKRH
jgi:hypothetical protein